MKCPYCNQEHDNGMAFCPITGKKLYVIIQSLCYNKACPLNQYNLPSYYKVCPICGNGITSVSFWGKTPNENRMPDLELNNSNSSYCNVCGHMHINESKICPIKEKSIQPEKVCAKCGSRVISTEHKFCSNCGSDKFKYKFAQTNASAFWDFTKGFVKVVITIPLVFLGILALPLLLTGQTYSVYLFNTVKNLWIDED